MQIDTIKTVFSGYAHAQNKYSCALLFFLLCFLLSTCKHGFFFKPSFFFFDSMAETSPSRVWSKDGLIWLALSTCIQSDVDYHYYFSNMQIRRAIHRCRSRSTELPTVSSRSLDQCFLRTWHGRVNNSLTWLPVLVRRAWTYAWTTYTECGAGLQHSLNCFLLYCTAVVLVVPYSYACTDHTSRSLLLCILQCGFTFHWVAMSSHAWRVSHTRPPKKRFFIQVFYSFTGFLHRYVQQIKNLFLYTALTGGFYYYDLI